MVKRVYRNDTNNTVTGIAVEDVADDYVLLNAETFTAPPGDLKTPLKIGGDGTWSGASDTVIEANRTKYLADNPDAITKPSAEQEALTALATDVQNQLKSIEEAVTALAKGGN